MKDIVTPVPPEETRAVIKKCLENAALVNYEQLSNEAKLEGNTTHFYLIFDVLRNAKNPYSLFNLYYSLTNMRNVLNYSTVFALKNRCLI